jgi:hypothetical protein
VERHGRDDRGTWWSDAAAAEESVPLPCPEIELALDQIYDGVQLPAVEEVESPAYNAG